VGLFIRSTVTTFRPAAESHRLRSPHETGQCV
jgi:hypothetical protein